MENMENNLDKLVRYIPKNENIKVNFENSMQGSIWMQENVPASKDLSILLFMIPCIKLNENHI